MKDKIEHVFFGMLFALAVGIPCIVSSLDLFAGLWGCLAGVIAGGVKYPQVGLGGLRFHVCWCCAGDDDCQRNLIG